MKAKVLRYEAVKNCGNYESKRLSIEIEIEDGEKAIDAYAAARRFVHFALKNPESPEVFNAMTEAILSRRTNGDAHEDLIEIQEMIEPNI